MLCVSLFWVKIIKCVIIPSVRFLSGFVHKLESTANL
jgi:hypothetical protein